MSFIGALTSLLCLLFTCPVGAKARVFSCPHSYDEALPARLSADSSDATSEAAKGPSLIFLPFEIAEFIAPSLILEPTNRTSPLPGPRALRIRAGLSPPSNLAA